MLLNPNKITNIAYRHKLDAGGGHGQQQRCQVATLGLCGEFGDGIRDGDDGGNDIKNSM